MDVSSDSSWLTVTVTPPTPRDEHDELHEQIGPYVLGALTPTELARLEAHLAVCTECAAEARSLQPWVEALAWSVPPADPPRPVRQRVLSSVSVPRSPALIPWLVAAASMALALGLGVYSAQLRSRVRTLDGRLREAMLEAEAESIAWHHAQIGDLYRRMGRLREAALEYAWADHSFPGHPFAQIGMAHVKGAEGDLGGAAARYEELMSHAPTPDVAEKLGDVYAALGRPMDASRRYALAEAGWRSDVPQPAFLARFLAEHDRHLDEAVGLAERAAADRHDIFTDDALAWCYFKTGHLQEAEAAITRAQRTGTREPSILYHAAAITQTLGNSEGARQLARRALDRNPRFDLRLAPAARTLLDRPF